MCSTLVQVLNSAGSAWNQPVGVECEDFDCEITDQNDSKRKLLIQVARVPRKQDYWRELHRSGTTAAVGVPADAAASSNCADAATPVSGPADSQVVPLPMRQLPMRQLPSAQPWRARILERIERNPGNGQ